MGGIEEINVGWMEAISGDSTRPNGFVFVFVEPNGDIVFIYGDGTFDQPAVCG